MAANCRKSERGNYKKRAEYLRKASSKYRAENPEVVKATKKSYYERNREKVKQKVRDWQVANRERKYAWNRKRQLAKYGLTLETYETMMQSQKHACAICGTVFVSTLATHVDHNHITGLARALLCRSCNQSLGHLEKDGGEWLLKALAYLEGHK